MGPMMEMIVDLRLFLVLIDFKQFRWLPLMEWWRSQSVDWHSTVGLEKETFQTGLVLNNQLTLKGFSTLKRHTDEFFTRFGIPMT